MQHDDGIRIGLSDPCNQLVLPTRHVKRWPIKTFALPFRRQPRDDYHDIRLGSQRYCGIEGLVGVDFLASAKTLHGFKQKMNIVSKGQDIPRPA